ncbi:hypothetical protein Gohar_002552 [Gossypium harknessii]|uniref:Uncharacterized protein n=2 Tax=Gossypium harknessii TaxID=34285 RepID=A0A7J9HL95_9ROSI|nr:hypothetical protein [Gossypium harknessii]
MALVVDKDITIESFGRTFADIKLDDSNQDLVLIDYDNEEVKEIANALEQFTAVKTPHLYKEVMSMEVEGFDDDFLCNVFDYLMGREFETKAFLAKSTKHRKFWLQESSQG